ncbi:MAG: dehydrogenase E1 component subunit alpha/beta [Elusimicrobiota bacterium]
MIATKTALTEIFRKAFVIRAAEQRLLDLFSQGKLFGTVHTCIGQELTGPAVAAALTPDDLIFSNHRCHGHFLARTGNLEGLLAEIMGKETGVCGGRGGSQHLCHEGFFSNGVQGSTVPVAAGLAYAQKLAGKDAICVSFIGDGTLGEGVLYEALNIASKWELPLLVVLENNRYAQSTPSSQTLAGDIDARAAAFGVETRHADVWNPEALVETAREAVAWVRAKRRPLFLSIDCDRLMAHSKGDDPRPADELARYRERDPLRVFAASNPAEAARFEAEAGALVDAATAAADAARAPVDSGADLGPPAFASCAFAPAGESSGDRFSTLLHAAFQRALRRDPRVILFGEDLESPYGGAFKVTKTLSAEFPGRVRNSPISEAALAGVGSGLALKGFVPVVEIMFGDFLLLAADQIVNSAAKFQFMYNGQARVPFIIRTPMGGRRGYGPTHSQSLEKHFLGVPGIRVLALNAYRDPGAAYDEIFASLDRPTIVIENKLMYGAPARARAPEGFALELSDERFPTVRFRPASAPDLTILCYGGMLPLVSEAAEALFTDDEIVCEVICPEQLYPFNAWPLVDSVRRSGRLLIAEEGQGFAAFGSEAAAQLAERAPGALKALRRLAAAPHAIPSCDSLEKTALPGAAAIRGAAKELYHAR